jgi:hypothetical protein
MASKLTFSSGCAEYAAGRTVGPVPTAGGGSALSRIANLCEWKRLQE